MKKIVIGISGASGVALGVRVLKELRKVKGTQTHLVVSQGAKLTLKHEYKKNINHLADVVYDINDLGASISSGTFKHHGMIIVPCSMKSVASIASGLSLNLLLRAADVCIKEKRKLVIVPRESPLSPIHLENLTKLSRVDGVSIIPPMVSYYNNLKTIKQMEKHIVGKILDVFDIEMKGFSRWRS